MHSNCKWSVIFVARYSSMISRITTICICINTFNFSYFNMDAFCALLSNINSWSNNFPVAWLCLSSSDGIFTGKRNSLWCILSSSRYINCMASFNTAHVWMTNHWAISNHLHILTISENILPFGFSIFCQNWLTALIFTTWDTVFWGCSWFTANTFCFIKNSFLCNSRSIIIWAHETVMI